MKPKPKVVLMKGYFASASKWGRDGNPHLTIKIKSYKGRICMAHILTYKRSPYIMELLKIVKPGDLIAVEGVVSYNDTMHPSFYRIGKTTTCSEAYFFTEVVAQRTPASELKVKQPKQRVLAGPQE